MSWAITANRLLTGTADLIPGWVEIENDQVIRTGQGIPDTTARFTLTDGILAPGLVDAQLNGAFGHDVADADPTQWAQLTLRLASTGVTAMVPTFITAALPELIRSLRTVAAIRSDLADGPGARVLAAHLEGPFLAPTRRGAHHAGHLIDPTPTAITALIEAGADGVLGHLTLAPERPGALAAVRRLVAAGVRVSIGHSDATDTEVYAAAEAGATMVTHLYNAQRPLNHRDPGVVGAALADNRLTCGLIVDGHHVLPTAIRIAFACKPGRIMLVTDATAALGMPPGRYRLGGQQILLRPGEPPRRTDGNIAGAVGRLDDAIGLAVAAGVQLRDAVEAATRVPADAVGRPDLGRIAAGLPADLVWLAADANGPWRARATWVAGALVHGAPAYPPTGSGRRHRG